MSDPVAPVADALGDEGHPDSVTPVMSADLLQNFYGELRVPYRSHSSISPKRLVKAKTDSSYCLTGVTGEIQWQEKCQRKVRYELTVLAVVGSNF